MNVDPFKTAGNVNIHFEQDVQFISKKLGSRELRKDDGTFLPEKLEFQNVNFLADERQFTGQINYGFVPFKGVLSEDHVITFTNNCENIKSHSFTSNFSSG